MRCSCLQGQLRAWTEYCGMLTHCLFGALQKKIAQYRTGKLQLLPGCDEEQSLEHAVMGVLNRIRNTASDVRHTYCACM